MQSKPSFQYMLEKLAEQAVDACDQAHLRRIALDYYLQHIGLLGADEIW